VPPLAGFLGSDALAGFAYGLGAIPDYKNKTVLFMDIGTNTELGLYRQGRALMTSVPGGSVFDGHLFNCGMVAREGAITNVVDSRLVKIGQQEPIGLCGSGYLDLLAELLKKGIVSASGRFADRQQDRYLIPESDLFISLGDIDLLQRAKGALAAAQQALLNEMELLAEDIDHILISGVFGQHINLTNAINLGLFVPQKESQFHFDPLLALKGCEEIARGHTSMMEELRSVVCFINLAELPIYDSLFVNNLLLGKIKHHKSAGNAL
jgi:uncharacterized 2Fe-2S/4Fe-4S cluster protein (DUF4445 family)